MDRKSIFVLVPCFLAFFSWHWIVNRIYPPKPVPPGSTNVANVEIAGTSNNPPPATISPQPAAQPRAIVPTPATPEELVEVTNASAHYTFSSHWGGLKQVELLKYPETVSTRRDLNQTNRVATLNTFTACPTLALLDGSE